MNALEKAIESAISSSGANQDANKAYLEFIKANFIVPVEKVESGEPEVLFLKESGEVYLPVFTRMAHLDAWAADIQDHIQVLKLSGVDLLKGIGQGVTVACNIGQPTYKAFIPAELERMRSMVLKIFKAP